MYNLHIYVVRHVPDTLSFVTDSHELERAKHVHNRIPGMQKAVRLTNLVEKIYDNNTRTTTASSPARRQRAASSRLSREKCPSMWASGRFAKICRQRE
jgi:hypothetical protein